MMMRHNGMLLPKYLHENQATAASNQRVHLMLPDGELSPVDKSQERIAGEIK